MVPMQYWQLAAVRKEEKLQFFCRLSLLVLLPSLTALVTNMQQLYCASCCPKSKK